MPASLRHVAEVAAAFVVEQVIAAECGDVDVVAAVIVVVADGHAQAIDFDVEAAAFGDVGEGAVVIVAIERGGGVPAVRSPVLAVDQQDVEPAIAIGIEKGAAGSHGLRQPFLAGAPGIVREVDARSRGHVGEAYRPHCPPVTAAARDAASNKIGNVIVNRLPLIIVLGAQKPGLRGERLRRFVRFETQEQLLFALRLIRLAQSAVTQHQIVVRLQIFGVHVERLFKR